MSKQHTMNPATLMRLWAAFSRRPNEPIHVLRIGAEAGCWPGTVYRATSLGYLRRVRPAWFEPTTTLVTEVRRVERIRRDR